ncbi:MAG: energy transducer TonB [Gemmatimonadota bacterium]|uniref:energy transducer TonB n=1 Tax=Candidatus Palauibacter scopulicola TaxID=3056741 RepID=UPI0023A659A9|nr:energy transducer TonB [Candidatus Palauibacter scopulicola]MDE2663631.1 energy transducer TonB [Candidatus Palauibacter scopulicola]
MRSGRSPRAARSGVLSILAALAGAASTGCADDPGSEVGALRVDQLRDGGLVMPVLESAPSRAFPYPAEALEEGAGGEILLRIRITAAGRVDSVAVATSSGHAVLDSAAVEGARDLRYRPARHGGAPTAIWATLPVSYPVPASRG